MSVRVIGQRARVVDADGGFTIDELAGNVATGEDTLSIALVHAPAGTAEPWLTLHYDEWICVLEGRAVFSRDDGLPDVVAMSGQTVKISKGTRFRPSFTEDTKYIPVCLPAFTPARCVREDEEGASAVAKRLAELHGNGADAKASEEESAKCGVQQQDEEEEEGKKKQKKQETQKKGGEEKEEKEKEQQDVRGAETLYHMTTAAEWEDAKKFGCYYPKTFEEDGFYTHATSVPSRLVETANHFYKETAGDWVCLEFARSALRRFGVHVKDEHALPVGKQEVDPSWVSKGWVCPHVIGGIPAAVVTSVRPMARGGADGKTFLGVEGL